MTQQQTADDRTVPAESITDFHQLYSRPVGFNEYRVLNLKSNEDSNTAYVVNLKDMSCTCSDSEYNRDTGQACKHLSYALFQAPATHSVEEHTLRHLSHVTTELAGVRQDIREFSDGTAQTTTESTEEDTTDTDDDAEDAGEVTEADADSDQKELLGEVDSWFTKSAGMAGFDPSIIELSWGSADGTPGIIIDRQPFTAGYYDDGEWQDKDGFDAEKETVTEAILSPNDAFEWYGEPDYQWFLPAEAATELVE